MSKCARPSTTNTYVACGNVSIEDLVVDSLERPRRAHRQFVVGFVVVVQVAAPSQVLGLAGRVRHQLQQLSQIELCIFTHIPTQLQTIGYTTVRHKLTFHQVPVGLDRQGRDAVNLVPPSASESALESLALATRCPRARTAALVAEPVATSSATASKASATSASTGAAAALLTPCTFGSYITTHKHNNKHMRNTGVNLCALSHGTHH
jgi:hypothetical protein